VEAIVGSGYLKTKNIEDIKSLISPSFALINPKIVCGELHLKQAAYLADKAHAEKYNYAKDRSTEVLLYLTAQRQISKAIDIGGIAENQKSVAWVSFSDIPENLSDLVSLDKLILSHEDYDYSTLNLDEKLVSSLTIDVLQKIVMTRTATLPVQSR
tara:strand:- start:136 stop:603 length:468 start_codon:yes stop_codon:yes gene_type:complete